MHFGILGPFEVADDGGRDLALGGHKQRAVLAILLLRANEVVSSDQLIDELWGEHAPPTAAKAIQVYVSNLRKALGEGVLITRAGAYVLQVKPAEIDFGRFEALAAEGRGALRAGDPGSAGQSLRQALALMRGPPLAEFAYEPFAQSAIARVEEARMAALDDRIDADLALGEHTALVGELEVLVREHPLRERLHAQLMLALYRSGRQAEALDAYQRVHTYLTTELGLEPGAGLKALQAAILNQDQSVAAPSRSTVDVVAEPTPDDGASVVARAIDQTTPQREGAIVAERELPLTETIVPRKARKVVTVLFSDVTGSTALRDELDPEVVHGVMSRYFGAIRATVERHGGTVEKFIGDAVMAVFGIPRVQEDDALRAVRAAAEIRDQLPAVAQEVGVALRFRTGVNTGLVLVGEGENLAIGDVVNVAARLQAVAQPGEILLGPETLYLVRDAVVVEPVKPLAIKGKPDLMRAVRLLEVDPRAPGFARRFDVSLVGRARELDLLRDAWDRAIAESGCHLFTLLGAAGVGKSRLVAELLSDLGDEVSVLSGRCLHYGEGITFWPLIEALTSLGEAAQPVFERLSGGSVATPEELFLEVRRLLESVAVERPVILYLDDLQWAEPMLLDLLDHVVDLSRDAPILLLCASRLELLEDRHGWSGGKLNATTVQLQPLGDNECETLLDQLADDLEPPERSRVISASQGNPLFLQEMVALMHEHGSVLVPSTIQAILAARLERLASAEREILERGAVEGEVFHRRAVLELAGERLAAKLDSLLPVLVRRELIRPHPATLPDDHAFRFRHLLIRDAAYDAIPKATRAELHEEFAGWLEDNARELAELDELAGWHLEQSIRYRRDLGRDIDRVVPRRAAGHLHAAARRASARSDVAAARNLFERALALAPAAESLRVQIGADLAEQLIDTGELARADELLAAAERDPDAAALAALTRVEWLIRVRAHEAAEMVESRLPAILEQLAATGNERGVAKAHMAAFWVHRLASRWTLGAEQARLAAEYARKAGDDGLRAQALNGYAKSIMQGPQHTRAIAKELDKIGREEHGPYLAASLDGCRSDLAALQGDLIEARRLMRRAIEGWHALGMPEAVADCEQHLAITELAAGNKAAALDSLLRCDAILAELGERSQRSTTVALLAETYELMGKREDALAAIDLSEELGVPEDVLNYAITHRVRARLALADQDHDAAERWARSAIEQALLTDHVVLHAETKLELARVMCAIGRRREAASQALAALAIFEAKGDLADADKPRALLDELARLS
jgi:class 3 adenylate cyclase/DNA-binding SARP family transcriptional activator